MLLAASPVTAPFSTCDLGGPSSAPFHGAAVKSKDSDHLQLSVETSIEQNADVPDPHPFDTGSSSAGSAFQKRLVVPLRI
jgi:hypothetical protein